MLPLQSLSLMESMTEYVVRRASEVKDYKRVSAAADVGFDWLNKLARGAIDNPGSARIERLYHFYKRLEKRKAA